MAETDLPAVMHATLLLCAKLAAPPLLAALVVGVLVSLVQAVMQLNETTLAFIPKVVALVGVVALAGGAMATALSDYAAMIFDRVIAAGGA